MVKCWHFSLSQRQNAKAAFYFYLFFFFRRSTSTSSFLLLHHEALSASSSPSSPSPCFLPALSPCSPCFRVSFAPCCLVVCNSPTSTTSTTSTLFLRISIFVSLDFDSLFCSSYDRLESLPLNRLPFSSACFPSRPSPTQLDQFS